MAPRTRPSQVQRTKLSTPRKPPIQRIFEQVMRREMTAQEKRLLHIAPRKKKLSATTAHSDG
jgi:hypothetical protein